MQQLTRTLLLYIFYVLFSPQAVFTQCWEWAQCIGLDQPPTSAHVFIDHIEAGEDELFIVGRNEDLNPIFLDGQRIDPGTFLLKTDQTDRIVNAISVSASSVPIRQMIAGEEGGVYLLGEIEEAIKVMDFELSPTTTSNFFMTKINAAGSVEYLKALYYEDFVYLNDFTLKPNGGLLLVGSWLDFSNLEVYLLELDQNGEEVSSAIFGGNKNQLGDLIALDVDGNIIIRGEFDDEITIGNTMATASGSSNDLFLAKFDSNGDLLWLNTGESQTFNGNSLLTDDQGNIYLAGSYTGTMQLDEETILAEATDKDAFVAKYTTTGELLWATKVGGIEDEIEFDLAIDTEYRVYLALEHNQGIEFGTQVYEGPDNRGLFLGQLDADGTPLAAVWTGTEADIYGDAGIAMRGGRLYSAGQFAQEQVFGDLTIEGSYSSGFLAAANFQGCDLQPFATCDATQTDRERPVQLTPLANDYLTGNLSSYEIVEAPAHGSLMITSDQGMEYLPEAGFQGVDQSTYKICVDNYCDTAVITFNVVDYLPNTLASIRVDDNGDYWPDSLNTFADLEGVVYGINLRTGAHEPGYKFTIINEDNSAGLLVYSEHTFLDYEVQEGDRIRVLGRIYESNGMTCILPDFIEKFSENNPLVDPEIVTYVSEVHENRLIRFSQKMWLEDPTEWTDEWSSGVTIDLFDGDIVWDMRIDDDSDIVNWSSPPDTFYITGIGYQRDHVPPFDTCYRILPRYQADFEAIIIDDVEENTIELEVEVFPNPANKFVVIRVGEQLETLTIYDTQGKLMYRRDDPDWIEVIEIEQWSTGTYFLVVENERGRQVRPLQVQH